MSIGIWGFRGEEWCKKHEVVKALDEADKLIEQMKFEVENEVSENNRLVIDQRQAIKECNEAKEENERLRKEKEWLIVENIVMRISYYGYEGDTARELLLNRMQQALKGGKGK